MSTLELKFSSTKGDFTLIVDRVAVLDKTRIPLTYLVPHESGITTTHAPSITELSRCLSRSPITPSGDTAHALLVSANGSRWLVFGHLSRPRPDDVGGDIGAPRVLKVKARMIGGHALVGIQRPKLEPGKNAFLAKKTRSMLDEHQIRSKRLKRSVSDRVLTGDEVSKDKPSSRSVSDMSLVPDENGSVRKRRKSQVDPSVTSNKVGVPEPPSSSTASRDQVTDGASHQTLVPVSNDSTPVTKPPIQPQSRATKDKLKKMIVTLLSLQGINKTNPDFKDLYQHILQASSFALRSQAEEPRQSWEEAAMNACQNLIRLFMGRKYRESVP